MRQGFTLIELLAVVAIVAMLIAILAPALAGARDFGKGTACRAHVRYWLDGLMSYHLDHRQLPRWAYQDGRYWCDVVPGNSHSYTGASRNAECPTTRRTSIPPWMNRSTAYGSVRILGASWSPYPPLRWPDDPSRSALVVEGGNQAWGLPDVYPHEPLTERRKVHHGRASVGFGDGHVESMDKYEQTAVAW